MSSKTNPPRLSWEALRHNVAFGSVYWCSQAPPEVQFYCPACDMMKHVMEFPRSQRLKAAAWYIHVPELTPVVLNKIQGRMRVLRTTHIQLLLSKWQCSKCRAKQDRELQNCRRAAVLSKLCRVCILPLHDSPDGMVHVENMTKWIRNTRTRKRSHRQGRRTCQRCFKRLPPPWSVAIRLVCRDWRDLAHGDVRSKALFRTIEHIGCSTIYPIPWKGGLDCIALFLGGPHALGRQGRRVEHIDREKKETRVSFMW